MSGRIVFLGTGGGGYMLVEQVLATGGIYLELDGEKILIDPGSGSLVRANQNDIDLKKLDCILLSHRHPDHGGDINAVIEAMCGDEGDEGVLVSERNCLEGETRIIDDYHEKLPAETNRASWDEKYGAGDLDVKTTRSEHYSRTVGFVIEGSKKIGYTSDGPYFEGQEDYFEGCDVLIMNTMMPKDRESEKHMTVDGAVELVKKVDVGLAVLNHFGFSLMRVGFKKQKDYVERETDKNVIYSRDGMEIDLENLSTDKQGLGKFTR